MAPLLSVIIPFYNGEKHVKNIAKAFLAQSVTDFELICVDDGSKDDTLTLLENLKKDYKELKIKVIHQENKGVSAARNTGLNEAEGEYISFVDCDDFITSDYVEFLSKNTNKNFDILVFQQARVRPNEKLISNSQNKSISRKTNLEMLNEFASNPTKYGVYNMFIKKSFYDKHAFKFREGYKYYEDYEFMCRVFALAENIEYTEKQLYFYIFQDGSAMQTFTPDRISCIKILEELNLFFEDNLMEFKSTLNDKFISRIYWSIMWQASIAFNFINAIKFAKMINVKEKVKPLTASSSKKVKNSSILMEKFLPMYVVAVKILGGKRSAIKRINSLADFEKVL